MQLIKFYSFLHFPNENETQVLSKAANWHMQLLTPSTLLAMDCGT